MQAKQQPTPDFTLHLDVATKIVHALANPVRIRIVRLLWEEGSLNVTEISQRIELDQSTVSSHLRLLFNARLLDKQREERFTIYSVRPERLVRALNAVRQLGTRI